MLRSCSPEQWRWAPSPSAHAAATAKTSSPHRPRLGASLFVGIPPHRVLDTRGTDGGPIGVPAAATLKASGTLDVAIAGVGSVPAGATSVAVNITIDDDATTKSFLTVWPTGEPITPTSASINNAEPGIITQNTALLKLGTGGKITVFNLLGEVNVIIDVTGYFVPGVTAPTTAPQATTTTAGTTTTTSGTTPRRPDRRCRVTRPRSAAVEWHDARMDCSGVVGGHVLGLGHRHTDTVAATVVTAYRSDDGDHEHQGDEAERERRGDVVPVREDHLDADVHQDDGEAELQVVEPRWASASRKYSARSPRMAKAFEAKTMNCSRLTARTAGTESTAKTTSVASMSTSTANSGVASRSLPLRSSWVNSFWPSYSVGGGHDLAGRACSTGLRSGWTSSSCFGRPCGCR